MRRNCITMIKARKPLVAATGCDNSTERAAGVTTWLSECRTGTERTQAAVTRVVGRITRFGDRMWRGRVLHLRPRARGAGIRGVSCFNVHIKNNNNLSFFFFSLLFTQFTLVLRWNFMWKIYNLNQTTLLWPRNNKRFNSNNPLV